MKYLLTMAVAALALAAVAQEPAAEGKARPRPPHPMMGQGDPVMRAALNPRMAEKLGLTEEQSAKLKALADDREVMKALQEKVRKGMERQAELLKAEKIDEAAVLAALDDVFETRKEIAKRQTRRLIAVKSILTSEQIRKASELLNTGRREKRPASAGCPEAKAGGEKKGKAGKKARVAKKAAAESQE